MEMKAAKKRKQTRRAIGLKEETYAKLREHCETAGKSMSSVLEEQIALFFTQEGKNGK